jgi:hypothetical protein
MFMYLGEAGEQRAALRKSDELDVCSAIREK